MGELPGQKISYQNYPSHCFFFWVIRLSALRHDIPLQLRLPRVDDGYTHWLKVDHVPGHNRHAMNERRRRNKSVAI